MIQQTLYLIWHFTLWLSINYKHTLQILCMQIIGLTCYFSCSRGSKAAILPAILQDIDCRLHGTAVWYSADCMVQIASVWPCVCTVWLATHQHHKSCGWNHNTCTLHALGLSAVNCVIRFPSRSMVYPCMFTHVYVCMCVCLSVFKCLGVPVCVWVCVCMCVWVCVCVFVSWWN